MRTVGQKTERRVAECPTDRKAPARSASKKAITSLIGMKTWIQRLLSFALAFGVFSSVAEAQMFLDEGDESGGAGVTDSVTASPKAQSSVEAGKPRKSQSKAAWSEKRKALTEKQAKAIAKSLQKRSSAQAVATAPKAKDKKYTSSISPQVASPNSVASSAKTKVKTVKKSEKSSGQDLAALSSTTSGKSASKLKSERSTGTSKSLSSTKSKGNSRAPASASSFATTKKACPLQVAPGAKENIGVTKFPRKLWVQDAGNPNYFKVVNREGREGFVKRSCFE